MTVELATIFERFGVTEPAMPMTSEQRRVFNAVLACRTPALGAQLYRCDHCHFE